MKNKYIKVKNKYNYCINNTLNLLSNLKIRMFNISSKKIFILLNNMKNKIKCQYCCKNFMSLQSKCNHVKKFHEDIYNKEKKESKQIKCKICDKEFSSRSSLNRHKRTICEINNTPNNNINNTINSNNNSHNTTINVQNIITINPYKSPNTNNLTLLDICDIFEKEFQMILKMIERTYFNKKIEENHCFNVSNMNGEYVNILENNEVGIQLKKYFFDELFNISLERIKLLYKTYKNKLFEQPKQKEIQDKIKALEEMKVGNGSIYKKYIKLINILAYNNKETINNTWNKNHHVDNVEIIWDDNVSIDEIQI